MEQTQQQFLKSIKEEIGITWDKLASRAGIKPRALKTYRLPESSSEHRGMSAPVKAAILNVLEEHRRNVNRIK